MSEGILSEKWIKWVALTTTILAVCAALSTLKGGSFSTKTQILTTQEANKWSYFQSKSIKQHVCELQKDELEILIYKENDPEKFAFIKSKLDNCSLDIDRYNQEKGQIKEEAEALGVQQVEYKRHSYNFHVAVMLLQIAIMLSSVGALIKQRIMWILGIVTGAVGVYFMLNGFMLWF